MSETVKFENYELLRREDGSLFELGRGAMGVTYKAFDTDLHCDVALKVINPGILGNTDVRERFLREARAAARLRHPNIATVFRLGRTPDDTHFYAMEFCEGPTLAEAVAQRGALPADEAVSIAWQVSKALILAEENQLLHRDLKPSNLILTERRDEGVVVKVIDFGLAKSFADGQQSLATTGPGGFVGTAQFASPEQLEEKELDIRSDIYSLGVCIWFMLTGKPQFEGSLARVMSHTLTTEPAWSALDGQPEPVVALLRRMLAKDRQKRPLNAAALKEEIEACYQSLSTATPATDFPRAAKPSATSLDEAAFNARFAISKRIGQDGMGPIFHATDAANHGKPVAVRMLDPGLTVVPALRREIEARIVAAMEHPHPNLLAPLAYNNAAQGFCIALPQTAGFTLLELLKQRSAISPAEALRVLEPLARAAGHAVEHKLGGFDLAKESVIVHFPGGLSDADRLRVLATPLDQCPPYEIKASAISLGDITGQSGASLASMATMLPAKGSNVALSPVKALANLMCEMLGSIGGTGFAPIARLSERANAVLRHSLADENSFASAAAFFGELRAAVGKAGSGSTAPGVRPVSASTIPSLSSPTSSKFKPLAIAAVVLLLLAGLSAGYWFGIHQPRERDRQKRQAEADAAAKNLAEQQRLAQAQKERAQAEAEHAAKDLAEKQRVADAEKTREETEKAQSDAERQRLALEADAATARAEAKHSQMESQRAKAELANAQSSTPAPDIWTAVYEPSSGTPERRGIMDALRLSFYGGNAATAHQNTKGIFFHVHYLKVSNDWALANVNPEDSSGQSTGESRWALLRDVDDEWSDANYVGAIGPFESRQAAQDALSMSVSTISKIRQAFPDAPSGIFPDANENQSVGGGLATVISSHGSISSAASSTPAQNVFGMIEGSYDGPTNRWNADGGSGSVTQRIIVEGRTFKDFAKSHAMANAAGQAAGMHNLTYTCCSSGVISQNGDGSFGFTIERVYLVSSSPPNDPTAIEGVNTNRQYIGRTDKMTYSPGRLMDTGGNLWIRH
jgi:serine/threonine protein kinase